MADDKKTKKAPAKKKDDGTLRGKAAFDAVLYYLRMAMGHNPGDLNANAYRDQAEVIFQTLPPDRKALVNLVRGSLTPLDPSTQTGTRDAKGVIQYIPSTRPAQDQVKFVSVPLSIDELAQLKALAGQSPQGSMSGIVADLVRTYLATKKAA